MRQKEPKSRAKKSDRKESSATPSPPNTEESVTPGITDEQGSSFDEVVSSVESEDEEEDNFDEDELSQDKLLEGARDKLAAIFEVQWTTIGWPLRCLRGRKLRTPDDLRNALLPLVEQFGHNHVIDTLTREESINATLAEVKATSEKIGEVLTKIRVLNEEIREQQRKCEEVREAVREGSPENRELLKKEITFRLQNRTQLTIQLDQLLRTTSTANTSKSQQVTNLKKAMEAENRILDISRSRLKDATDDNWEYAKKEQQRRREVLTDLEAQMTQLQNDYNSLDERHKQQSTGFSRRDFLNFIVEQRGEHHPHKLANAAAGLPELSCRTSYTKCNQLPLNHQCYIEFLVFQVIERAWNNRDSSTAPQGQALELVQREINKLPKTVRHDGKKIPNYLLDFFQKHELPLRKAIASWIKLQPAPPLGQMPYIVTGTFTENMYKQRTIWERLRRDSPTGRYP